MSLPVVSLTTSEWEASLMSDLFPTPTGAGGSLNVTSLEPADSREEVSPPASRAEMVHLEVDTGKESQVSHEAKEYMGADFRLHAYEKEKRTNVVSSIGMTRSELVLLAFGDIFNDSKDWRAPVFARLSAGDPQIMYCVTWWLHHRTKGQAVITESRRNNSVAITTSGNFLSQISLERGDLILVHLIRKDGQRPSIIALAPIPPELAKKGEDGVQVTFCPVDTAETYCCSMQARESRENACTLLCHSLLDCKTCM